jgi:hypothetical protein
VVVPLLTPVTMPEALMVALVLLGDHVPPGVASESVMVEATQTEPAPVMAAGSALTVNAFTV